MNNGNIVLSNLAWRFAERVGAQGVRLLVELVLARLLLPDDYGVVAIVTVLISFFNVFVDSGFANALIQKLDADDLDFSSVFWFNILWCIVLYTVLFFIAPLIALFYGNNDLIAIIRVLGVQIIISGVKNVEQAYVSRNLLFRKFFFATLGGTIGAAVLGVFMALHGYGVWALVAQHLFNTLLDTIILWITVKWRPKFIFSLQRLKSLFSYGWKLLVSALIDTVYNQFSQLLIGKVYTSGDLAYYNRGNQFPSLFITNINSSIDSVLLPTLSKEQRDKQRVKEMTRRSIQTSVYVIAPLMIGLIVVGEPFVRLILTEKWLPCVFYMRIFCIAYIFYPIHTANLNAIKALGRSDIFLKLEVIKKIFGLTIIISTVFISLEALTYSTLLVSVISQIVNSWPNKKLLSYGYFEQLKDIGPSILLSCVMGAAVYMITLFHMNDLITLALQIISGIVIYIALSKILHLEIYEFVSGKVKSIYNSLRR